MCSYLCLSWLPTDRRPENWEALLKAFLAFSLVASAGYLINDLADLEADRKNNLKYAAFCLRTNADSLRMRSGSSSVASWCSRRASS